MGNIPGAVFKCFFRQMAFHVCYCRCPFSPSTQFQNDKILCLYISKYRTSLAFCSAVQRLDRGVHCHRGMLESRQSFCDALSASVVEKDSGDLPTRMLSGFPGRFAFCLPCYVWAFAPSAAQPSALRCWTKLWYCYQWLPACKNKKCTFSVVIMKMHFQCEKTQFLPK